MKPDDYNPDQWYYFVQPALDLVTGQIPNEHVFMQARDVALLMRHRYGDDKMYKDATEADLVRGFCSIYWASRCPPIDKLWENNG